MRRQSGFTLVELLVVIAIIGMLIALLLPAVQAARSAARKIQCANNFKQVALGVLNYASLEDHLPPISITPHTNGTYHQINWRFHLLPFLEEQPLYDLFSDQSTYKLNHERGIVGTQERPCIAEAFLCPATPGSPKLHSNTRMISRKNGDVIFDSFATKQSSVVTWVRDKDRESDPSLSFEGGEPGAWLSTTLDHDAIQRLPLPERRKVHDRPARLNRISDGLSKTILIYEESGAPDYVLGSKQILAETSWYHPWIRGGTALGSGSLFTRRYLFDGSFAPRPVNYSNTHQIFSFHPGAAHVSMCDGSVRFLADDSSREVVFALGTRNGATLPH